MDDEPVKTPPSVDPPAQVPATIGPYRVDGPLGRGGMGEVYHGHDDRLDRPVALKRVRARAPVPDTVRERFRREARALARVRHPCVVEVYDWIEGAVGDWLVMELVAGESLQQRMRRGRLPLRQALEIGRDVAAGLASVHGEGIVHRDLKPDNIMVIPPEGRIKLLDFGLAKRIDPVDGGTLGDTISEAGQILGTVRFMSPEQASGRRIDQRSDCFSLGVLLYEMLTGVAPFRGDNTVETLTRICTIQEAPIRDLEPDLSMELAERVHSLLVKEPERRTASASEIAADLDRMLRTLDSTSIALPTAIEASYGDLANVPTVDSEPSLSDARQRESRRQEPASGPASSTHRPNGWVLSTVALVLVGLAGLWWSSDRRPPDPIYVAVPPAVFVGDADEAVERRLDTAAIEDGMLLALLDLDGLVAVEPKEDALDSLGPVAMAHALGADEVMTSELTCDSRSCRVRLKRLRGDDGRVIWMGRLTYRDESLFEIGRGTADQVRSAFPEIGTRSGASAPRVTPADYQRLLELRDRLAEPEISGGPAVDVAAEFEVIRASSPDFVELYRFAAGHWAQRFDETRNSGDLKRAREAIEAGRRIAPHDPRILRAAVSVHLVGGELEAAKRAVEALRVVEPGDADVLWLEAKVVLREGQLDAGRRLILEALDRRPAWRYYANLAIVARDMGRLDESLRHVDAMLERAPESYYTQSLAAEFELLAGNVERATELYELVVQRRRGPSELTNLGTAYFLRGRHRDAASLYAEVVDMTDSVSALLNLADAELLLGEASAADHYRRVLARIDEDPEPATFLSVRAQALAHLGDFVAAVEAIQSALRQTPDNANTAFEAAVVYAVVGEETSALLHARRALDAGVNPIWFDFPWFDGIRGRLSLSEGEPSDGG